MKLCDPVLNLGDGIGTMYPIAMETYKKIKRNGNAYPNHSPTQRLFERQGMIFFLKKTQVDAEHDADKNKEGGEEDYFVEVIHWDLEKWQVTNDKWQMTSDKVAGVQS